MKEVIIAIVVMVIIFMYHNNNITRKTVQGVWVADPTFCEEQDIDNIMMVINEKNEVCYVVYRDGEVFILEYTQLSMNTFTSIISESMTITAGFSNVKSRDIPEDFKIKLYPYTGKMILYTSHDGEKIPFAVLYKDSNSSELQNIISK